MRLVLNCSVFRRQAEGIPTHRMHHIKSAHSLYTSDDIANRVVPHMAHVQRAAGIGQHFQNVVFGFRGVLVTFKYAGLFPPLLPFGFDLLRFVPCLWNLLRHALTLFLFLQSFLRSILYCFGRLFTVRGELLFQRRGKHGKSFFGGGAFFA